MTSIFLVDFSIKSGNKITVYIDSFEGATVDDCISLSRRIEGNLDREIEDFELDVSSPGLDQPLRVLIQYKKNIGREVQVKTKDNKIFKGILISADENGFVIECTSKVEGKKSKQTVVEKLPFDYKNTETKIIISFKNLID